jgi:hypothetical protein
MTGALRHSKIRKRAENNVVSPKGSLPLKANGFQYHPNWLHSLLIASSMGGLKL